jgi:hypothetical protein
MHILKARPVAEALRRGSLSQRELFFYFLGALVVNAIQIQWMVLTTNATFNVMTVGNGLLYIAVLIAGTIWLFKVNASGDGAAFIERYICLSLPLNIQFIILKSAIYLIYLIAVRILLGDNEGTKTSYVLGLSYAAVGYLVLFAYYGIMGAHIRHIAVKPPSEHIEQ